MSGVTIAWDESSPPITDEALKYPRRPVKQREEKKRKARERYANDPAFREAIRIRTLRYRGTKKGKAKARANYLANRDRRLQQSKAWRARNPDCRKDEHRRWKDRNPNHREIKRGGFLKKKYGISLKDYDRMVAEQKGGCAICHGPPPKGRPFSVDHDHTAQRQVRGLLCQKCNTLVGYLEKTSENILFSAKLYITASKALALVA